MGDASIPPGRRRFSPWRLLPVLVLLAGLVLFFALGFDRYFTLAALREHRAMLTYWVGQHLLLAVLAFVAIYAVSTTFSLPIGSLLTLTGGFLFGALLGTLAVVIGATIGATLVFLAAKTALGDLLRAKAGPGLQKMQQGFAANALSYLLFLRLVPAFPFWLVNLAPAFLGVSLRTFILGTFVGIIPGTFVYAFLGRGFGQILDAGQDISLRSLLTPQIVVALALLAVFALLPVLYKKFRGNKI